MGYINGKGFGKVTTKFIDDKRKHWVGKYCLIGLYCSDTDLVQIVLLPEKQRVMLYIDDIDVIKDQAEINSLTVLYDKVG